MFSRLCTDLLKMTADLLQKKRGQIKEPPSNYQLPDVPSPRDNKTQSLGKLIIYLIKLHKFKE